MTTTRRVLLASAAVAVAIPALPAPSASADPIVTCSATFLIGPYRCAIAAEETRIREENPAVDAILREYVDPLV